MRATTKYINQDALAHNLKTLSALAPQSQCIAVIKSNAYGCEIAHAVTALRDADLFAVASIDEAIAVREIDAHKPILLLEGVFEQDDIAYALANQFEPVIATPQQLDLVLALEGCFSRLWFKLDTGMGRLGFQADSADKAMQQLLTRYEQKDIVIMTHFSDADTPERDNTEAQISRFDAFARAYPECKQCLCNSAGTIAYPEAHRDFIRPGLALYGVSPFENCLGETHGLRPVMTLKTRVVSIKSFEKGEPIGYGQTYKMPEAGRIAVCEVGYADGYLRFIPTGTPVLIAGREYSLAVCQG